MPLSVPQSAIADSDSRFRVAICGRRFGKTHLAMRELAKFSRFPQKNCWFIAPTRSQGKGIVWDQLKQKLGELNWIQDTNESDLIIKLVNGSKISIKSADAYDRMRGFSVDFVVFDEFADMNNEVWTAVRPTLSDKSGHALFIGTPKGVGNWAKDIWDLAGNSDDWSRWQYTTIDGGRVSQKELDSAKSEMDEKTFRQEYEATFETYSGKIYYSFTEQNIVNYHLDEIPRHIYVGMDFNIDPMTAVIANRENENFYIFDEIRMFSSNTQEMVDELEHRYPGIRKTVYPDPAARQRKTSAGGQTDISILKNAGYVVKVPNKHDQVRDGINAVNARFCDANNIRYCFVDKKCKYTIESLERHTYKPGTTQPDKDSGYDHMTDALRYMITYIWPLKSKTEPVPDSRWTHRIA